MWRVVQPCWQNWLAGVVCAAMRDIDHEPGEKRPGNGIWWFLWLVALPLVWAGYLYFHGLDLWSIAVGGATGGILASWAIEITGNKVPNSWRR